MQCPVCNKRIAKGKPCKFCNRVRVQEYKHTLRGKLLHRFSHIVLRCRRKGWRVEFSKNDFVEWSMENGYPEVWEAWKESGFKTWETPSVDRIDDDLGYSLTNIRWITWKENYRKECIKRGFDPFVTAENYPAPPDEEIPDYWS